MCPSGEYYQQRTIDVLDEILGRYPVDGFFFNWFNFNERDYSRRYVGVCQCESCHRRFAEHSDRPLPVGPESANYFDWLGFSFATTGEVSRRISEHITSRRSDVALVLRRGGSIAYQEANNAFGVDVWHHETGEAVSAHVTANPAEPVMVNSVAFVDMPYRMAGEQPERFAQYLIQAIARGGNPSTYIMGAPGRVPYANLPAGREVNRFHRRHVHLYTALQSAATIAVARPNRWGMRPDKYKTTVEEYRGIYASLQQAHHPFDVVGAESLAAMGRSGRLDRYSLVVLPDLGPLGAETAAALDDYAANGGHLLCTGGTGVTDDGSVELESSPARARTGEPATGSDVWSCYATLADQPDTGDGLYAPPVVPVWGTHATFDWKPAADRLGAILPPAPYGPPEKCYGHVVGPEPAAISHEHGRGGTTMIPWTVGRTYREFATTEVRSLLLSVVEPYVETTLTTTLPEQVELVHGADDEATVLHLLNLTGARHRTFGPHVTIPEGQIRLHGVRASSAHALVADRLIDVRHDGDDTVLPLPPLESFEVLRITTEAGLNGKDTP